DSIGDNRIGICVTRGWICPGTDGFDAHDQKIYERELMRLEMSIKDAISRGAGTLIAALHYPPSNDKFQESGFTEMLSRYNVKTCVYGHLHGREAFKNGYKGFWNNVDYKLVSLDYVNATPVKIFE
ncbi:MAG: serine/threonine protein phosphatase, partial [Firmicutes bacterium]|nr:serine/threonine protein phosphatase [Bacillota bacterium]